MSYRTPKKVLRALVSARSFRTAREILRAFERPLDVLFRYLTFHRAGLPRRLRARAGGASAEFTVYSPDDVVTAVECFARGDYGNRTDLRCVVDFGANIGISGTYFLTASPQARLYGFEPDPRNFGRLRDNLTPLAARCVLRQCALGTADGRARFGREPTGRYGGLGLAHAEQIEVEVADADRVLRDILAVEGHIDLLKVDIEGYEQRVLRHLSAEVLRGIGDIVAEISGPAPALAGMQATRTGSVTRYRPATR